MTTLIDNQTYVGTPKPDGTDNHAHCVAEDNTHYRHCTFIANGASEALKSSKRWHIHIDDCVLHRGVEDCGDHVRGGAIGYSGCEFKGQGRKLTIKGSVQWVSLINNRGLDLVVLGDYTKYDAKAILPDGTVRKPTPWSFARPPVRSVHVHVPDGERTTVICLHAERPTGNARVIAVPSLLVSVYFWLRATLWKEAQPVPNHEFQLEEREC